jgi:hypothetical protein
MLDAAEVVCPFVLEVIATTLSQPSSSHFVEPSSALDSFAQLIPQKLWTLREGPRLPPDPLSIYFGRLQPWVEHSPEGLGF